MHCEQGLDCYSGDGNGANPSWSVSIAMGHLKFVAFQAVYGTVKSTVFDSYRAQCRALGLPVVGYGFVRFGTGAPSPESQAEALLQVVGKPDTRELTPVLDLEMNGVRPNGWTPANMLEWFERARATVKKELGVDAGIYSSNVVLIDPAQMDNPKVDWSDAWFWDKHYPFAVGTPAITDPATIDNMAPPPVPPQFDDQWMWHQYEGDAPSFPGMIGKVDPNRSPIIELGMTGGMVKYVQKRVGVTVDGDFGPKTQAAVTAFQNKHGLIADGRVGLISKAALSWVPV